VTVEVRDVKAKTDAAARGDHEEVARRTE
jgi:hypothetical protein